MLVESDICLILLVVVLGSGLRLLMVYVSLCAQSFEGCFGGFQV